MVNDYGLAAVLAIYRESPGKESGARMFGMRWFNDRNFYVEIHGVHDSASGGVQVGPGRPLSVRAAREVASALGKETVVEDMGLLPERVLAVRPDGGLLWWVPAERRTLIKEGWDDAQAWFPPLVFVRRRGLAVFALAKDERPQAKTKLYRAPLWNVGERGGVCMGSGRLSERGTALRRMEDVERAFFGTPFSHELLGGSAVSSKDLDAVWQGLRNTRRKFPVRELVPLQDPATLGDLAHKEGF